MVGNARTGNYTVTLSDTARQQVFGQEGGGFLVLLTITHADLITPIRVVNNTEAVTSNGVEYIAYPFAIKLPESREGVQPHARLTIDNVSREIAQTIRSISTPPTVNIQVIRIDDLDAVEMELPNFQLRNVEWDILTLSGDLQIDDITREPYPQRSFTPAEYPGLF